MTEATESETQQVKRKHPLAICEIPLTTGGVALVDEDDYERVIQYKWYMTPNGYVKSTSHLDYRFLHHFVLHTTDEIDHINRNRADCCKENLRVATRSQNLGNSVAKGGVSQYKGVYWHRNNRKWIANITINYKCKYIGSFENEEDAARAYDEAAREAFGEFARTNF